MPKLPNLAPAPLAKPDIPTIETSQNILPKPLFSDHGGKRLFRIDAKLFSFSFDGGRSNLYAIHETRRDVKSCIHVRYRGIEWILTCLADVRDWVPSRVVLCKRFRENRKLIEFCGRSNRAGLFVVIAEYFGGSRRGCIMIPVSSNRACWSLFQREIRNFFSGAKPISMAEESFIKGGEGGQSTGGGQSRNILSVFGNQQKSRKFENYGTISGLNVIHGDPLDNVSVISGNFLVKKGRPMWAYKF